MTQALRLGRGKAALGIAGATAALALLLAANTGQAAPSVADWPLAGRDLSGQRYVDGLDLSAATVGRLGFAFEFRDFVVRGRTHRGVEANPLLVNGVLYFSGPWGVAYAVDARSGQHLWTYDPEPEGSSARLTCCDAVNRGVAVADGRLFTAATDGQLAAVDARTGKELWKVNTIADPRWNTTSTGAPRVAGNVVIIGNAGSDMGSRGYLSAYDVATGKLTWRFWVVPGDPAAGPDESPDVTRARATWPKDARWDLGLGGNPWDGLAFDPETDTVFVGTGNGGPHPVWLRSHSGEATDQLYLSSIVALDAKTGRVKWHYQTTPADSWDYAATSPFVMAEVTVAGKPRKVIMQAPKNGIFYMLDRVTGELLTAKPYTYVNWTKGIDMKTGRPILDPAADYRKSTRVVWPSMAGGHSWAPMAFSPRTGLVYLPVFEAAASYTADPQRKFVAGGISEEAQFLRGGLSQATRNEFGPFRDKDLQAQLESGAPGVQGRLKAIDPVTGEARWQTGPLPMASGGTLVVGDLVFQGDVEGYLHAYDATTGERRLRLFLGTGIMGAPMAYQLDGVTYLAVLAGFGGPQGAAFPPGAAALRHENFERLIVLKLDGGPIPLPPAAKPPVQAPMPKPIAATPAVLARGQALYQQNCHRCHWVGGAQGIYPNLWNMSPETLEAFEAIVGDGAFAYAGMASFADVLSRDEIAAVKAFIVNDTIAKRTGGPEAGAQYTVAGH